MLKINFNTRWNSNLLRIIVWVRDQRVNCYFYFLESRPQKQVLEQITIDYGY